MDSLISDNNIFCRCPKEINRVDIRETKCFPFRAFNSLPNGIFCIPILSNKLYDCRNLSSSLPSAIANAIFTIDGGGGFREGDHICIDQISISYKCIGISSPLSFTLNGDNYNLVAINLINPPLDCACSSETQLFNNFSTTILNNSYITSNCRDESSPDIIERYFFQDIDNLYICDLNILANGVIGCNNFSAYLNYEGLTALNTLGFNAIVSSPLCISTADTHISIFESFDYSLQLNSIVATAAYSDDLPLSFPANIYYTLNSNTNLRSTAETPISVFTPNLNF